MSGGRVKNLWKLLTVTKPVASVSYGYPDIRRESMRIVDEESPPGPPLESIEALPFSRESVAPIKRKD